MSSEITTAFVNQYKDQIFELSQQRASKLRGAVTAETGIVGSRVFREQVGSTTAQPLTSRHSDTPVVDVPHSRRALSLQPYVHAPLIDRPDQVRMLIDPTSLYARAGQMAMGRAMDDVIIAALGGVAQTGANGTTAVALPSAQKIAVATSGLTLTKLRTALEKLRAADVPEDEEMYIVCGPQQITNLLGDTNVTSSDYNTVKALVNGEVNQFLNFKFIVSTRLNKVSTTRSCFAFCKSGVMLGIGQDVKTEIERLPTKNYSTQVYVSMDLGATRMEEVKVVQIDCLES